MITLANILLKEIIDPLAKVLVEIFNKSLTTGEFPAIMKLAEVVPLYKNKEHYLESNYRPISLLTTMSKILEKIMYKRVYSFSTEHWPKSIVVNMDSELVIVVKHAVGQAVGFHCKGLRESSACSMCATGLV